MPIINNATVSVTVSWDEPTTSSDGSPLNDLSYTSVYYQVNGGPDIVGAKLPATKLSGGGNVATTLIIPAPAGSITRVSFQESATDLTGNESPRTAPLLFVVERLAPSQPTNFIVV